MRRDVPFDLREPDVLFENVLDGVNRQPRSGTPDEERRRLEGAFAAQFDVIAQRDHDNIRIQSHAASASGAAGDVNLTIVEIDIGDVERYQLADANAGREEKLQNQIVADGAEVSVASARRMIA